MTGAPAATRDADGRSGARGQQLGGEVDRPASCRSLAAPHSRRWRWPAVVVSNAPASLPYVGAHICRNTMLTWQSARVGDVELAGWWAVIVIAIAVSVYVAWSPRLRRQRVEVRATLQEMAAPIEPDYDEVSVGRHRG
jgi:hypothetical protein